MTNWKSNAEEWQKLSKDERAARRRRAHAEFEYKLAADVAEGKATAKTFNMLGRDF